jgi:hypothetical protein
MRVPFSHASNHQMHVSRAYVRKKLNVNLFVVLYTITTQTGCLYRHYIKERRAHTIQRVNHPFLCRRFLV